MQIDFHYYATYCAAYLAGYSHEESMDIGYSSQFVDECTRTLLAKINGPLHAATTQSAVELGEAATDMLGLQDITRIWASFHFLPYNLYADPKKGTKRYKDKYRLLCGVNSDLLVDTVDLAKGGSLQAVGIAMHVLADTWAHRYFAGTPSLVLNNTTNSFYEIIDNGGKSKEIKINFRHSLSAPDDLEKGIYTSSMYRGSENSVMNLGHGRAGHLPDYSFMKYKYMPVWADYRVFKKDNPADYYRAFCQMIYAMKYMRGVYDVFEKRRYDSEAASPWKERIMAIIKKRRPDASNEWKALGEELSGRPIEPFDVEKYQKEYAEAYKVTPRKDMFIGKFVLAALAQKSMVTNKIFKSGNMLAGISVEYDRKGFKGIRAYRRLVKEQRF